MRGLMRVVFLTVVVLLPKVGTAQVYRFPTTPPEVTAAGTSWLAASSPIFYAGNYYYPSGPAVFFDGNVMNRTGNYNGVPLFEDATLEPYSIVYVPIGNNLMRPYERRREGELAGTVGSRMPSFPIQRDAEIAGTTAIQIPPVRGTAGAPEPLAVPEGVRPAAATPLLALPEDVRITGAIDVRIIQPEPPAPAPAPAARSRSNARPQAAPAPPQTRNGVWIEYQGARYYSAGPSIGYDASRFQSVGDYRGFPVYREARGASDRIYVAILPDGPIAPFDKR
jgi:hypothetical protein